MFWKRFAAYVASAGLGALGVLVPPLAPYAIPAAVGLAGLATNAERVFGGKRRPEDEPTQP